MTQNILRQAARVLTIAACLLPACGGEEVWLADPDDQHADYAVSSSIERICSVAVAGVGTLRVEEEYIPRVVWCEIQGEERHQALLRAQAIAARTFMYYKRSLGFITMKNSTDDQVYKLSRCSGPIPEEYLAAARDTAGVVLARPDGELHCGYYRAGTSYRCRDHLYDCFGEPCMGQMEASACAAEGYGTQAILDLFFESPLLERTAGSCGVGTAVGDSCSLDGTRGTCQTVDTACAGSYAQGLCDGGMDIRCCLSPAEEVTVDANESPAPL